MESLELRCSRSTMGLQAITQKLIACINRLEKNSSHDIDARGFHLGTLAAGGISLFDLCRKMKQKGFEYASFIPSDMDVLKGFKNTHRDLCSDYYGKPTHSIYFSKLESVSNDSEGQSGKFAPGWFNWLHDLEDGPNDPEKIAKYQNSKILFAQFDPSRVGEVNDIKKFGVLIDTNPHPRDRSHASTYQRILLPDYAGIQDKYDGVHTKIETPMDASNWAVETIAIWNTSCLNQMKYFDNTGKWSYAKEPLFDGYGAEL